MDLFLAQVACGAGGLPSAVGLSLPGSFDSPNPGKATSAWRRKARRNARSVAPPAPARTPDLALTARARNRHSDFAVDGGLSTERRPVHETTRTSRPFNDVHGHGGKPVAVGPIADRSGDAIGKLAEPAIGERQLFRGQDRVGCESGDRGDERVPGSSEPRDLDRVEPRLADMVRSEERRVGK